MSGFFRYCVKCKRMFQAESAWNEHLRLHRQPRTEQTAPAPETPGKQDAANVPGTPPADVEDERLAKSKELRAKKKVLKESGVECATMTAQETQEAYDKLQSESGEK